jgi:hypothetical protein
VPAALVVNLPAQAAAGATVVTEMGEDPTTEGSDTAINRVRVTSPSLVTGVATNNATINVRRWRAGVLVETTASITLASGTNLPAATQVDLPVIGSPYIAQGDTFDVQQVQNGTGLATPAGIAVEIEIS